MNQSPAKVIPVNRKQKEAIRNEELDA